MAKTKESSAATRFSAEELGNLTPDQVKAYVAELESRVDTLSATNKQLEDEAHNRETDLGAVKSDNENLKAELLAAKEEAANHASNIDSLKAINHKMDSELKSVRKKEKATKPVSFEVESEEDPNKTLTYEFTAPALTWDDHQVYNIRELSESKEKAGQQLFEEICAKLVQRQSGLVRLRKED